MNVNTKQTAKYHVPAVDRAISILEVLADDRSGGLGITEISQRLNLPKSSVLAILATLEHRGFVRRLENQKYLLGMKTYWIGAAYVREVNLIQEFHVVAKRIVAACGETVQLAVLQGIEVVYIAIEPGTQSVRLVSAVGQRLPVYATALGKALLASLKDGDVRERFAGRQMTPVTGNTITSIEELLAALQRTRECGYSVDRGEVAQDLYCVAAVIHDSRGDVVAAMSVSLPASRGPGERLPELGRLVVEEANYLSSHLGYIEVEDAAAGDENPKRVKEESNL